MENEEKIMILEDSVNLLASAIEAEDYGLQRKIFEIINKGEIKHGAEE